MDAVRKHTLSIGSKWGETPSQIGFYHKLWRKRTPAIARHCSTNHSGRDLQYEFSTISGLCPAQQLDLWGALPKVLILSRCFTGWCLHTWGRSILLPPPWLPSFSRRLLLSGLPVASSPLPPCSFLCGHHTSLPIRLLRCICPTPDRRLTSRNQPG